MSERGRTKFHQEDADDDDGALPLSSPPTTSRRVDETKTPKTKTHKEGKHNGPSCTTNSKEEKRNYRDATNDVANLESADDAGSTTRPGAIEEGGSRRNSEVDDTTVQIGGGEPTVAANPETNLPLIEAHAVSEDVENKVVVEAEAVDGDENENLHSDLTRAKRRQKILIAASIALLFLVVGLVVVIILVTDGGQKRQEDTPNDAVGGPSTARTPSPTFRSSLRPSEPPDMNATVFPTHAPTSSPTILSSQHQTELSNINPTAFPTQAPTRSPTRHPSTEPTTSDSQHPTELPSANPTVVPTDVPSSLPTRNPSALPTFRPSQNPTQLPSLASNEDFEAMVSVL